MDKIFFNSVLPSVFSKRSDLCSEIWNSETCFDKGHLYLVEAERLCRYMDCCGLELGDLGKAIKDVAHANGVDINNIALVIESGDVIDDIITEAKKVRSKSLVPANRLKNISDLSKKAKSIGIKVVKRKSKRKYKKRHHLSIGKIEIN